MSVDSTQETKTEANSLEDANSSLEGKKQGNKDYCKHIKQ